MRLPRVCGSRTPSNDSRIRRLCLLLVLLAALQHVRRLAHRCHCSRHDAPRRGQRAAVPRRIRRQRVRHHHVWLPRQGRTDRHHRIHRSGRGLRTGGDAGTGRGLLAQAIDGSGEGCCLAQRAHPGNHRRGGVGSGRPGGFRGNRRRIQRGGSLSEGQAVGGFQRGSGDDGIPGPGPGCERSLSTKRHGKRWIDDQSCLID
mmetsp:Transcript_2931/g.8010  ORF Transcript_2931/g.8010 Transcript_2931/m.8010 type:complete len:201 (+) Transcript_2931:185-787(+)